VIPLLRFAFLALLAVAGPAYAQQGGVTILRGNAQPATTHSPPATPTALPTRRAAPQAPQPIAGDHQGGSILPPASSAPPGSVLAQAMTSAAPLPDNESAAFAAALKALDQSRWSDARAAVANFPNPLLKRYVEWSILRAGPRTGGDFAALWRFLREHPEWPEPEVLRRQAEDRLTPDTPAGEVHRYFTAFPPLTSTGLMRRLAAASEVAPDQVQRLAGESWRSGTFRTADEAEFLARWGRLLTGQDHVERFDRLMREGRPQIARELVSKLPSDYQPVANARLAMATRAADAPAVLKGVPAQKLDEPTLRLERAQWLRRGGNLDEAKTLLSGPIANQTSAWWNERHQLARDLLAANRAADAYAVTLGHGQTRGVAFAEAEFLAGWIALRHLKKPEDGRRHFQTLFDGVSTDISKSRAAYWLGRAHEAAGRAREASEWYGRAAGYGTTYYGQLAARKLPGGAARLPSDPVATAEEQQAMAGRELATVARYLGQAGDADRSRPFLLQLARLVSAPGEVALLARLAVELRRPDVALTIARRAVENGVTLFDSAFPVVELGATGSVERALALALARQESAFNAAAVSSSGALGLMQLMPGTARDVSGRLGVPFVQDKLTRDPAYNVALGSQYLAEMLQRFGGSYELALAAYNAGPNRVARWLETAGDPRSGKIDMVDWIEMIPFRETRNYVQRVMEGVGVYRDRLNGPFRTVPPAMGRS
jgi:soluble lytic murein transglycosylase